MNLWTAPDLNRLANKAISCINPAGGPRYHLTAWQHGQGWSSHRAEAAQWIGTWSTTRQQLLLIGPSAGYSLNRSALERFARIDVLEPDPLARFLLRRRFRGLPLVFHGENFCSQKPLSLWPEGILFLKDQFPDHALIFCNFLGQLPLLFSNHQKVVGHFKRNLHLALAESQWLSYHDLWSTRGTAVRLTATVVDSIGESARHFFGDVPLQVNDHQTQGLLPEGGERRLWGWQIRPHDFHCVEAVRSRI